MCIRDRTNPTQADGTRYPTEFDSADKYARENREAVAASIAQNRAEAEQKAAAADDAAKLAERDANPLTVEQVAAAEAAQETI